MEKNNRVQSEFNTGTVVSVNTDEGTATIKWDGFGIPIKDVSIEGLKVVEA